MTAKLIFLRGLPGSGKSHWAAMQVPPNGRGVIIINKDNIRTQLTSTGWVWSPENEKDVIAERDKQITAALTHPDIHTVISDDTNFGNKHENVLRQLAKKHRAEFEIKVFDTPIEECIRRDSLREGKAKVGEGVIKSMAARYLGYVENMEWEPVEPDPDRMPAIICDIDGTLALFAGKRSPYDHAKCEDDDLNVPVRKVIETFYRFMGYQIIYLSAREDKWRPQTEAWFRKQGLPPGSLHMRLTGDSRNDAVVKYELFNNYVRNRYNVVFVLDDRPRVLRMWQTIGLFTLAVGDLKEF